MFYEFEIRTRNEEEIIDITKEIENIIEKSNVKEGIAHIFVPHATAGVILNESADPNIKIDFLKAIERIVPKRNNYLHDRIDSNAAAHIKSAFIGSSLTIPIKDGNLYLGTWQSIMFCEFDGPRSRRKIIVQVISN
jgi:secondary thiamine-phosphate synthase enzyme